MKIIKTNDVYTINNWDNIIEKCGGWNKKGKTLDSFYCENINLKNCPYYSQKRQYYSQSGEEGIIEAIFNKIAFTNKVCIELGANDGKSISNTFRLKEIYNFTRFLIEGDKNIKIHNDCKDEKLIYSLINSSNINELLKDMPDKPDFLSIDLDGDDYWILKAMKIKPRVIILEYNTGLPNELPLVCKEGCGTVESHEGSLWNDRRFPSNHNPELRTLNGYFGANLLAYNNLMNSKDYTFVTSINDNLIYIINEEFHKLNIVKKTNDQIILNYFCPNKYWGDIHRDMYNNEWLILNI